MTYDICSVSKVAQMIPKAACHTITQRLEVVCTTLLNICGIINFSSNICHHKQHGKHGRTRMNSGVFLFDFIKGIFDTCIQENARGFESNHIHVDFVHNLGLKSETRLNS